MLIYARTCGVVGSLGASVTINAGGYRSTISGRDLAPFSDNGTCGIDFTATARGVSNYTGSVESETRQYATLDSTERLAADLVRGTVAGQKRWRKEVLIPAFGLIGGYCWGDFSIAGAGSPERHDCADTTWRAAQHVLRLLKDTHHAQSPPTRSRSPTPSGRRMRGRRIGVLALA